MTLLLLVFSASFVLSVCVTPLVRFLAIQAGLIDKPDNRRKIHGRPIAVAGGISVWLCLCVVLGFAFFLVDWNETPSNLDPQLWVGLLLGTGLICAVGIADDL